MKLVLLLIISIIIFGIQYSQAEILSNDTYFIQGMGFAASEESIDDSELNFQFSTGALSNGRMKVSLHDGLISIAGNDFLAKDWSGTVIRDGKFLLLSGFAENVDGDEISINLVGRLIQNSQDGSVYSFTGKIKQDNKSMKVLYTSKIIGISNLVEEEATKEKPTQEKSIQINILSGASNIGNINYFSQNTIEITPGTSITWKNDDSMSHRIMSGIASFSHGKPFTPDGKIDSGDIAPGKTFKTIINDIGITRFFDSKYTWMDGVIISLPESSSESLKTKDTALDKTKKYQ